MKELQQYLSKFGNIKIEHLHLEGKEIYCSTITEKTTKEKNKKMFEGIPIGNIKNNKFKPSLFLLEEISKQSNKKIYINNKAEWLFLCKRDVFEESIIKIEDNDKLKTNEIYLIQNEHNENLGIAQIKQDGKNKILKNLFDRGDFLRRERKR